MYQDRIPQNSSKYSSGKNAHEIDYQIFGEEMQFVEIELDPQEGVVAEAGTFMMMDDQIGMNTIFGDGSNQEKGLLGKIFSAGKRILTGESLFMTVFTNNGVGKKQVSFASPYPGKIIPIDLTEFGGKFICQKDAFLCAAKGVSIGIEFSKKLGRGLFGGEGFIMQKMEGDGLGFIHAGGTMAKKILKPGEVLKVDTGCIVGFTKEVDYDIEFVGGIKNTIFGGEGLFFATLRGPGTVYIQSLPFSRLAGRVLAMAPRTGGGKRGEGSVLGGIGDLLDGDNRF
ncbi:TIGR00266 family protein [Polaribacter batillariae]|uniref:TIGR00266 family protein n=1 Tax=Polaribacter batillariae TaxID=2808900 RepID=A0ABX7SVF2_9FLAO|nr:TIGR00266 family protein [Polaribacter batillariae]QTD38222.1 TIGR00266 family protein [Polaribacter batillariae]